MNAQKKLDCLKPGRGWLIPGCFMLCLLLTGCEPKPASQAKTPQIREAAPVKVKTCQRMDMPVEIITIGAAEPYSAIAVKAQVSGVLTGVWFNEGDEVKKDQRLFSIDPRPFEALIEQAKADLAKAHAQIDVARANLARNIVQLENATAEYTRNAMLLGSGVVTREEFDRVLTNARSFEAAVRAEQASIKSASAAIMGASAAIDSARIELDYCNIRSPIDGKTGSLLVNRGNIVKANDTISLVAIHQVDPIYVTFTLPERNLPEVKRAMAEKPLEVVAVIPDTDVKPITGTLTFLDNSVNQKTGTIRLKATFDNKSRLLWPGQFISVRLVIATRKDVPVAPVEAVQTGQAGSYVYIVNTDSTAEHRKVVTGYTRDGLVIIEEGLQGGETLVTDGHLRVAPGGRITIPSAKPETAKG